MKTTFLIFLCRATTWFMHLVGRNASVFPGQLAYDLDNNILSKIKYPKLVIGVTGSSGKGSTIEFINHILKNAGYEVACNKSGSNGVLGITTLILNNTTIFGHKPKKDVYLLECDERHIGIAFKKTILTHLVVTNITRDQPARNVSPEFVFNSIFDAVKDKTTLIINSDDPLVNKIKITYPGKIITFGINKTKYSYKNNYLNNLDSAYCPICHKKLIYDYYHYGHIGSYRCPNNDFKRENPDYTGDNVNLEKLEMTINKSKILLSKNIFYNAYAVIAAFSLCSEININKKIILDSFNKDRIISKRGYKCLFNDREFNMLESKNENALSYYQSLEYIVSQAGFKTVIIGFDNVSRRYKLNDLSWLYDVDFEKLNDSSIDKIVCLGKYKYDVATRLSYANIPSNKLILLDDMKNLLKTIDKDTNGKIYTMVCFDMTGIIKQLLKEYSNGNN